MIARVLSDGQVRRLHGAALSILERTGVQVPHETLLSRFADEGALVDPRAQIVRIPPALVERLVACAGKRFTLHGRDPSRTASFGAGHRNYNSIAGEASWVERPGSARRYATLADVVEAARLGDALEGLTIVGAMADPSPIPVAWRCVEVLATLLRHTTKPVTLWFHDRASARFLVEMMVALRGTEAEAALLPPCYPFLEPISPLRFPFHGVDLLFETARLNLPVPVGPMAQMGLSAPATLAGTLAQEHAEILAGICITQLVREGMPVCYGGICHAFDMRTTQMIFGGPEQAILGVAMTQMGKSLGLPVYINVGLTDSKLPDAQAGIEAGITLALGAAAGADIFGHLGICGVDQASCLDTLVLQEEIVRYVESTMREIAFDDEALGLDEIKATGPGGTFIDRPHTAAHYRKELWFPKILDRRYFQSWHDGGAEDAAARCRRRREELLRGPGAPPLPAETERAILSVLDAARRHLG